MCSPVLGWGEARRAAAAIAGERLPGGAHVVVAEGQEAAGRARVQHAWAVEEGEAALGQGGLEGTEQLSGSCSQSGAVLSPPCCASVCWPRWQVPRLSLQEHHGPSQGQSSDPDLPPPSRQEDSQIDKPGKGTLLGMPTSPLSTLPYPNLVLKAEVAFPQLG